MLLKPERLRGIDYLGDDWAKYNDRYQPKGEPTAKQAQWLIGFVKLVNLGDDAQFKTEIEGYLDVDGFLRFMAINAMVANMDSFLSLGHNYFMYLHPKSNRFVFMPWDLDLAFAGFPFAGSADQQADLSLTQPYFGQNKLIDRLFAVPGMPDRYRKIVRELGGTCFSKERLFADIDVLEKVTKEALAREKKAAEARKDTKDGPFAGMFGKSLDLRTFVEKRTASVAAQLDGKRKGYIPTMNFGGPGHGFRVNGRKMHIRSPYSR
jgi:spore coat protein CotH